ncbi:MAG: flagellar protein FlaB [Alphaproteobacteria bacterium]|nr:flagellar protein FlaB [Alphaproteobacteria bacterium]
MLSGVINTNVNALYALNSLSNTASAANTLEQQLSSGQSINSPADNPAGYIAAQGFTTQIGGTEQAISNVNQAISLVQTADGSVTQQVNILQQLRTIAAQSANGINSSQQLQSLQQVVSQLQTQVTTISQQAVFSGLNLLDGSLNGVQFQVGSSEGQTIGLSIASTAANNLGSYQSASKSGGIYSTAGSATGGVGDTSGNSFTVTSGTTQGAFTAGAVAVSGSAGSASATVTGVAESAQDVAASINQITPQTNVSALANTSVAFTVTSGSISFKLGNGSGTSATNSVDISATVTSVTQSGLQSLVSAINQQTGTTGITATVNSSNQLILNQGNGDNISISSFAAGGGSLAAGGVTIGGAGATSATVQGLVTLQSNQNFAIDDTTAGSIGLGSTSSLSNLSSVNVSTTSGANAALNVVDYALQQLENIGAQLGAVQQRLQATASNLQSTDTNLTTARSIVQDANIPQVTSKLTTQQILQQAGVSALAQSSSLEQSYLKLLQ